MTESEAIEAFERDMAACVELIDDVQLRSLSVEDMLRASGMFTESEVRWMSDSCPSKHDAYREIVRRREAPNRSHR